MPAFAAAGRAAARLFRPRPTITGAAGGGIVKKAALRAGRHLLGHVGQILRRIGLQISAMLYLIFALGFGADGYRDWAQDHKNLKHQAASLTTMSGQTELLLGLALVFLYFGVSSWARSQHGAPRAQAGKPQA